MYAILTLQMGLNPEYVLDKIEVYEISALMKYSYYKNKEDWEQARLISYLIAQTNSTKKLKLEDIIKFSWEGEKSTDNMKISQEEIEALQRQAEEMEKYFQNNNQ